MRQFLDVVHQAVASPLPVHLGAPTQCEAMQALVASQVAEDRLDGGKARGDHALSRVRVDPPFHPLAVVLLLAALALEERDLARLGLVGCAQALGA